MQELSKYIRKAINGKRKQSELIKNLLIKNLFHSYCEISYLPAGSRIRFVIFICQLFTRAKAFNLLNIFWETLRFIIVKIGKSFPQLESRSIPYCSMWMKFQFARRIRLRGFWTVILNVCSGLYSSLLSLSRIVFWNSGMCNLFQVRITEMILIINFETA